MLGSKFKVQPKLRQNMNIEVKKFKGGLMKKKT